MQQQQRLPRQQIRPRGSTPLLEAQLVRRKLEQPIVRATSAILVGTFFAQPCKPTAREEDGVVGIELRLDVDGLGQVDRVLEDGWELKMHFDAVVDGEEGVGGGADALVQVADAARERRDAETLRSVRRIRLAVVHAALAQGEQLFGLATDIVRLGLLGEQRRGHLEHNVVVK